jgi:hypothetical protein
MNFNISFISAAALFILVNTACATSSQHPDQSELPTFSQLDKNQDGYISEEETKNYSSALNSKFDQIDKNGDQKLDRFEFSAFEAMGTKGQSDSDGGSYGGY